jgi:hypothetical protein
MTPETNRAEDLSAAFDEIEGTDETGEDQSEQETEVEVEAEVEGQEEADQAIDEVPEAEEVSEPEVSDESEVATESSDSKPPVSWKASAREEWSKIPDGARQEIQRREADVTRTLQESSNARGFTNDFAEIVQPYMAFIQAENSTPLNAVGILMQTAAGLRIGSPAQKAQIIHSIMQDHAVDVQMLDQLLVGEEPQAMTPDQIDQLVDQRVAMATSMQPNPGDQVFEQDMANAHAAIEVFASDPKNEFFEDVRADMIYLLQSNAQKGQTMTLEQSYNEAIRLNPEIQDIMGGRSGTGSATGAARRKKAASSIKSGAPSGRDATGGAGKTLADDLAATWAALEEG